MTKDTLPTDFTIGLALVDALPVIFFGIAFIFLGVLLNSIVFIIGAAVTLLSGAIKVLWKILVVTNKKNYWPLFVQMRIAMPVGFVIMIVGFVIAACTTDLTAFWQSFAYVPCYIFLGLGVLGMIAMIVFAFTLNSADKKANWVEQTCNGIAQFCFFLAVLLAYLH